MASHSCDENAGGGFETPSDDLRNWLLSSLCLVQSRKRLETRAKEEPGEDSLSEEMRLLGDGKKAIPEDLGPHRLEHGKHVCLATANIRNL